MSGSLGDFNLCFIFCEGPPQGFTVHLTLKCSLCAIPQGKQKFFFFFIVFLFMNFLGFTLGLRLLFIWKQVMPAVIKVMKEESSLVTLVKPQFEARRSQVRKLSSINLYSFLLEIIKYRRDINWHMAMVTMHRVISKVTFLIWATTSMPI